jgi:hypothetical protein
LNDGLIHGDMPTVGEPDVTTTVNVQEIKCLEMVMARPKKLSIRKIPTNLNVKKFPLTSSSKKACSTVIIHFPIPLPLPLRFHFPFIESKFPPANFFP